MSCLVTNDPEIGFHSKNNWKRQRINNLLLSFSTMFKFNKAKAEEMPWRKEKQPRMNCELVCVLYLNVNLIKFSSCQALCTQKLCICHWVWSQFNLVPNPFVGKIHLKLEQASFFFKFNRSVSTHSTFFNSQQGIQSQWIVAEVDEA